MPFDFSRIREELSTLEGREAFRRKWDTDMAAKAKALDFTNVKERNFNIKHLPDGDYPARISKVEDAKSSKSDEAMWLFTIELTGGGAGSKGASFPYYCVLNSNNLWKVRNLFAAAGVNIPKKRVNTDPNKVVGKAIGVTLGSDEYDGKMKSVIEQVLPLSEIDESGRAEPDDDEDTAPKSNGKAAKAGKEAKAGKAGKKGKKAKPAAAAGDEELEELEIEDL